MDDSEWWGSGWLGFAPAAPANLFSPVPMPALVVGTPATGLAQRPIFNSGTNVLTWQGPVGGGPSNGDYTFQSRVLTASGAVTTTADNQVIEGLAIVANLPSSLININHNNVTVRQCFVQVGTFDPAGGGNMIFIAAGKTGTVVEDCYIDGNANANEVNGITGDVVGLRGPGFVFGTVRRNFGLRLGQLIRNVLNNVNATENYCQSFSGVDADHFEVYPTGGVCNNLFFQYNVFDGTDNAAQGANSAINLSTSAGLPDGDIGPNITIDSNWFLNFGSAGHLDGHAITIHVMNNSTEDIGNNPGHGHLQFSFTNNGYYLSDNYGTPGGANNLAAGGLITPNSGNYIMATPTSRSGSLINGTGAL